jgi:hypothetical protein
MRRAEQMIVVMKLSRDIQPLSESCEGKGRNFCPLGLRLLQSFLDVFPERASGGASGAANDSSNSRAAAHDRSHCSSARSADGSAAQAPLLPGTHGGVPPAPSHKRINPKVSTRFMLSSLLAVSGANVNDRVPDADLRNPACPTLFVIYASLVQDRAKAN